MVPSWKAWLVRHLPAWPRPVMLRWLGGILLGLGVALLGWWARGWLSPPPGVPPAGAPWVWVWVGEQPRPVRATQPIPANLLASLGVRLYPGDRLRCDGVVIDPAAPRPWREGQVLQVEPGRPLRWVSPQGVRVGHVSAATVGEAAWQMGARWRVNDALGPSGTTPLSWARSVRYGPARPALVRTPQGEQVLWARADTVGAALAQGGLALEGLDFVDPGENTPWPGKGPLRLVRVREEIRLEQRPLAYQVRYEPQPDLEIDQLKVVQEGALGVEVRRVRVRYQDGQEVARQTEASWVARPPQDRIVGYGTKIVIRTLDTPSGPIRYWRALKVYATSYSPCRLGTGYCNDITASGRKLHKGIVAVLRSWFYSMNGQRVYVPGYGVGVIGDVGGGIPGRHWIDLGYDDDNYVSWHQWVTVYFLAPPPPPENILWILP